MAGDVSDAALRAEAAELEGTLSRWKLEGFDPVAGLDLLAAARLTLGSEPRLDSDGVRLIIAELDGISEFSYSIHLSPQAVSMIGGADFTAALGAAVAAIPDLAAIVQPLLSYLGIHSEELAGQADGGPLRLAGVIPSPFPVPVDEAPEYWEAERQRVAGAQRTDDGHDKDLGDHGGDDERQRKPWKNKGRES
ncbi:hypothetical protein [Nocardia sp. NPDC004722]